MNRITNVIRKRLPASFFCLTAMLAIAGTTSQAEARTPGQRPATAQNRTDNKSEKSSFAKPDFAFPQTVATDARAVLDKALRDGNALNALGAAVQIDVARSLVSAESCIGSSALFDSLATVLPKPYGSLALLLEARLYKDIYESAPWQFDRRQIPSAPVPSNVLEWNRGMFVDKVGTLVSRALAEPALASLPLADIKPLLVNADDAVKAGMSTLDFATLQGVDLLENFARRGSVAQLPFGDPKVTGQATPAGQIDDMLDKAIARHRADADKFVLSYFCEAKMRQMSGSARTGYIKKCMEEFGTTPYCAPFLSAWCDGSEVTDDGDSEAERLAARNRQTRRKYELLSDYIKRFPNGYGIGNIEDIINSLARKSVTVTFAGQMLPGRPGNLEVSGANLYDFYVLVYKMPEKDGDKRYDYKSVRTTGRLVKAIPVKATGTVPDSFRDKVAVDGLEPGTYAFIPSTGPSASGIIEKYDGSSVSTALVGELTYIVSQPGLDEPRNLYIVSAVNQQPCSGARITLWPLKNGIRGTAKVMTADAQGKVSVPDGQYHFMAEAGGNSVAGDLHKNYYGRGTRQEELRGQLLSDLSIYRPGDKTQFSVVAYSALDKKLTPASGRKLRVWLCDANNQKTDSTDVVTDALGRADGSFIIPQSGMLGSWYMRVESDGKWITSSGIEVADYKSPTFHVAVESSSETYKAGETLTFRGTAATYAGMPVQGGKVSYTVKFRPMWWRAADSDAEYGGETTTGADGSFAISLPTTGIKDTPYARGGYVLNVTVTDAAGETQEAPAVTFTLGDALHIASEVPSVVEVSADPAFKVSVYDMAGHPVKKTLYYDVTSENGETVASGNFDSPKFTPDLMKIPSGRYAFRFSLTSDFKKNDSSTVVCDSVTIWRPDDKVPPVSTPLWMPQSEVKVPSGTKNVKLRVGSSYPDSYILAQVSDSEKLLRDEWLKVNDGFVTLNLEAPADNRRLFVEFAGTRDLQRESRTVTLIPQTQTEQLQIETVTFRDRIEPGAREEWKFRFKLGDKTQSGLPAMAVMSNKALNALMPFSWTLDPYGQLYWNRIARLNYKSNHSYSNSATVSVNSRTRDDHYFSAPEWNTYGYSLYSGGMSYGGMSNMYKIRGRSVQQSASADGAVLGAEALVNEMKMADFAVTESEAEAAAAAPTEAGNGGEGRNQDEPLREIECPLAFFMPSLTTDSEGIATLGFTAPAFVGTWQLQVAGYTSDMKGAVKTLDAVSAKKVMAQLNAPRFVRTGDHVSVAATLYNNSADAAEVGGRIEIVNALSGAVMLSQDFAPEQVQASGSRAVMAEFAVPQDVDALLIRAYATMPGHSDGEQTAVAVLPSSTPVTESTPFYIAPDTRTFTVKLPKFYKGSKVTLTYCDNPVWECVTALPSILTPKSVSILSQVEALYGNAVAAHLFGTYPQLTEGVRAMAADSTLVSPLSRNAALKTVMLNNTPWVNDASSETARMQSLVQYADPEVSRNAVSSIMKTLADRQRNDGGWSWCPDMESSTFITERVLARLASLSDMDCLPEGGDRMARKAFVYVDNELAEEWNRGKRKYFSMSELLDYLYAKSAFGGAATTSAFSPLDKAAIKKIAAEWRDMTVRQKATASILLNRRGMSKEARLILESLRQFASVSPEKGMWFDNLASHSYADNALLTTARVLEAYAELEPQSPAVDALRQWMVMSKQTQNWGDNRTTAEAIDAILTSGSEWTAAADAPTVTLGGKSVTLGKMAALTGAVTVDLDLGSTSGKTLEITRTAPGPAWGGVVARYVAPIVDVKTVSTPQLAISKAVYTVTPGATGTTATAGNLKVGDRVRVTLTIASDRDIEYVAVTDPRAACLEPADQISGYAESDGLWFYREVRDSSTNLFIPYLSKGTHVISYECYVDREGEYTLGVAQAQSQYAPEIAAHSGGAIIPVR